MKKAVLRYGGFSILFVFVYFIIVRLSFRTSTDFPTQEIFGWTGIGVSVLFVFFGIKYYRDRSNAGILTFGQGLKVGLLIVLFPAVAVALFDILYTLLIDPECVNRYYEYETNRLKASLPAEEFRVSVKKMEQEKAFFVSSPFVQFMAMFVMVFAMGLIVAVISTFLLKRRARTSG
jgi:Protein of unknown function (DUF4199)